MNVYDLPPRHCPAVNPAPREPWCPVPPKHGKDPFSVIHHFNKVCFKNVSEATTILKNKHLLPGEVGFAYYYDKTAEYGINAIAAVGSLKVGGANILFNNAESVQELIDKLSSNNNSNNEKIIAFQNTLDSIKEQLNKVTEFIDKSDQRDASINELFDITDSIDSSLDEIMNVKFAAVDASFANLYNYKEEHEIFSTALDASVKELFDKSDKQGSDTSIIVSDITDLSTNVYKKIEETKQELISYTDSSITGLEDKINKSIQDLSSNYSGSLSTLKTSIMEYVDGEVDPIKSNILDIDTSISDLYKKVQNASDNAVTDKNVNSKISEALEPINSSIRELTQTIHDYDDKLKDVSKYAQYERETLRKEISTSIEELADKVSSVTDIYNADVEKQNQYLKDSIEEFKKDITVTVKNEVTDNLTDIKTTISDLSEKVETEDSALNAKISTINNNFDTYKIEVQGKLDTYTSSLNTSTRNYINTRIDDERTYLDSTYARKDSMPVTLVAGNGILIENGIVKLNIDNNGILRVNGKKYQLTEI